MIEEWPQPQTPSRCQYSCRYSLATGFFKFDVTESRIKADILYFTIQIPISTNKTAGCAIAAIDTQTRLKWPSGRLAFCHSIHKWSFSGDGCICAFSGCLLVGSWQILWDAIIIVRVVCEIRGSWRVPSSEYFHLPVHHGRQRICFWCVLPWWCRITDVEDNSRSKDGVKIPMQSLNRVNGLP